eukprot:11091859-Prorocentrum_lima.AAC.1
MAGSSSSNNKNQTDGKGDANDKNKLTKEQGEAAGDEVAKMPGLYDDEEVTEEQGVAAGSE